LTPTFSEGGGVVGGIGSLSHHTQSFALLHLDSSSFLSLPLLCSSLHSPDCFFPPFSFDLVPDPPQFVVPTSMSAVYQGETDSDYTPQASASH
ncbi:hypothetical protein CLOP_g8280, partial [Closterium sp. NIES-67]